MDDGLWEWIKILEEQRKMIDIKMYNRLREWQKNPRGASQKKRVKRSRRSFPALKGAILKFIQMSHKTTSQL